MDATGKFEAAAVSAKSYNAMSYGATMASKGSFGMPSLPPKAPSATHELLGKGLGHELSERASSHGLENLAEEVLEKGHMFETGKNRISTLGKGNAGGEIQPLSQMSQRWAHEWSQEDVWPLPNGLELEWSSMKGKGDGKNLGVSTPRGTSMGMSHRNQELVGSSVSSFELKNTNMGRGASSSMSSVRPLPPPVSSRPPIPMGLGLGTGLLPRMSTIPPQGFIPLPTSALPPPPALLSTSAPPPPPASKTADTALSPDVCSLGLGLSSRIPAKVGAMLPSNTLGSGFAIPNHVEDNEETDGSMKLSMPMLNDMNDQVGAPPAPVDGPELFETSTFYGAALIGSGITAKAKPRVHVDAWDL